MPIVKRLAPILSEHALEKSDNKYAQDAGRIMKAVGFGKSGGNLHNISNSFIIIFLVDN